MMILQKYSILLSVGLISVCPTTVLATDSLPNVDLWLPKSYQKHYIKLVEVAKKIQDQPDCSQLLSGRLKESRSTLENPVFYFRCRDDARKSFSYDVELNTMAISSIYVDRKREQEILRKKQEAEEQIRLAQEQARLAEEALDAEKQKEKSFWKICHRAIKDKISGYNEATIVSDLPPKAHALDADTTQYKVNFDSVSFTQKVLRFSVRCNISSPEEVDVKIKRRKK